MYEKKAPASVAGAFFMLYAMLLILTQQPAQHDHLHSHPLLEQE